jgi:stage IV sporulation protein A
MVITTDGSITDIEREDYIDAETRVVEELKALGKPFVVLINTARPYASETETLKNSLAEKYGVPILAVNCAQIKAEEIHGIMEKVLYEFPLMEMKIHFPKWIETLAPDHWLKQDIIGSVKTMMAQVTTLREVKEAQGALEENEYIKKAYIDTIKLGHGGVNIEVHIGDDLFYRILSETTGMDISSEYQLISTIKVLAQAKRAYDKVKYAMEEVKQKGYGIVTPVLEEMRLEAPMIVKHGAKYGVKIKARAPSIHLIRADIETEISPIVGTQQQSEDLISYLTTETAEDPSKIWTLNMFGKSMHDLVKDGLQNKLYRMPEDAQMKLQETLQKIINEGSGGLICIML